MDSLKYSEFHDWNDETIIKHEKLNDKAHKKRVFYVFFFKPEEMVAHGSHPVGQVILFVGGFVSKTVA